MYIFLKDGVYNLKDEVKINYSMMIIGAGRNKTFIHDGGFLIKGIKEEGKRVELKSVTTKNITITRCGATGRLVKCVVTDCGMSGIRSSSSSNGLIELEGC
jgi:hypothetical protein